MRRAAKKDQTHAPIVDALEAAGIVVFDVSGLSGLGFDILCYHPKLRVWLPMEIKSNRKVHHRPAERLRPSQVRALALAPIPVVETVEQAMSLFRSNL